MSRGRQPQNRAARWPAGKGRSVNEREILALIQQNGSMSSTSIAQATGLSAQAASVITRTLETDGLITRGDPLRGKVGKPQVPFELNPDGAFSLGLRIGRRSADIVLIDLTGRVRGHLNTNFPAPTPERITGFAEASLARLLGGLAPDQADRVAGIGIGVPFEMWNWLDETSVDKDAMRAWQDVRFGPEFATFTDLPIAVENDASMACLGEYLFGGASGQRDLVYLYVGAFIGGGIVLDGRLYTGPHANAGAFASMPIRSADGSWGQLISSASIYELERRIDEQHPGTARQALSPAGWNDQDAVIEQWLIEAAAGVAHAAMSAVAVLDLPLVVIDGSFPPAIRTRLVAMVRDQIAASDGRGLVRPEVQEGVLGRMAGALGSGYQPLVSLFFREDLH